MDSIPYGELKELCKTSKKYGRKSPYSKDPLQVTFSAHVLVSHDIRHVMSLLLPPTELLLWESIWKKQLKALVHNYRNDGSRAHFTVENLSREKLQPPQEQAQLLPKAVLEDIKNAAQSALFQTPDGTTPIQNFSDIRQDETFIKFVDRLKDSIDKQIDSPQARKELLNKLAVSNANPEGKKVIRGLPLDPEPTIQQMVEA